MTSFRNYALLHFAVLAAGGLIACLATPAGSIRIGAEMGAGSSAAIGLLTIAFGAQGLTGNIQRALFTLVTFFLARMIVVAATLFAVSHVGGNTLSAAIAFLGMYLGGQILELAFLSGQWRAAAIGGNRA